jgi:pimeloyl-ACP methyl ester carboxylesterase
LKRPSRGFSFLGPVPPKTHIGADQDQAVPVENSNILAEGLPDAESCILHGGGHMVNLEQPEGFNDALLGYLAGL